MLPSDMTMSTDIQFAFSLSVHLTFASRVSGTPGP
ncbi:hypothetical protein Prudu_27S000900 [Prunus dulcis]|uniref:Uncharacterized protein n=1 Tax=Prunus dulcis TaxID=3755 RepID=A0A5H2XJR1_PRUDU|nr:hypothetical protein Prudu_27S000900 [Prunus dulcis]